VRSFATRAANASKEPVGDIWTRYGGWDRLAAAETHPALFRRSS
jgi:hypothetical protein